MPRTPTEGQSRIDDQITKSKTPTAAFVEYAAWLADKTGVKLSAANLQLSNRLYHDFQKDNAASGGGRSHASRGTSAKPASKPKAKPSVSEDTPAPAKPARRGAPAKPAAKPAAKAPAGKPAAAPRSGRRGKPASAVEAPY
jgi:hypothetical protein